MPQLTMQAGAGAGAGTATATEPETQATLRKPSSPRRIAASRANGLLSRGPQSAQGKLNSAASNRKHGFYTDQAEPNVDPSFLAGYIAAYQPQNPHQVSLVGTIAKSLWLQDRVQDLQTEQLKAAINLVDSNIPASMRATLAFRNLCAESGSLVVSSRLVNRYGRQFERALDALTKSQRYNLTIDPSPTIEQNDLHVLRHRDSQHPQHQLELPINPQQQRPPLDDVFGQNGVSLVESTVSPAPTGTPTWPHVPAPPTPPPAQLLSRLWKAPATTPLRPKTLKIQARDAPP